MPIYIIFNRETGELVQTHIEPEEVETPREELLSMVASSHDPSLLDVTVVEAGAFQREEQYQIDLQTRRLTAAQERGRGGFGAGAVKSFAVETAMPPVKTVYEDESGSTRAES